MKRAHGNRVATSLAPQAACAAIREGARDAAARCAGLKLRPAPTPTAVRVEATGVALAELFAMLPLVKRIDPVTIEFSASTMRSAVRVLNSLSAMSSVLR